MSTAAVLHRLPVPSFTSDSRYAALRSRAYRIYLIGQSLSNTGTWMRSIAQDWLVLSLTHSAGAVGLTMALQFLPTLLLGGYGGLVADRMSKRTVLLTTQSLNAGLAATLALLTITGRTTPMAVYAFAWLGGLVLVLDGPARQAFVCEVVAPKDLRGAISLNSAVFQATRLFGPALAGVMIGAVGPGWVFAANAGCYLGPTVGLLRIHPAQLQSPQRLERAPHALRDAVHYVLARPHLAWTILLVGVVGTFGLNFPVVLTSMARSVFHGNASLYGLFNIALAVGSVGGAVLAGVWPRARLRLIVGAAVAFGAAQAVAALAPDLPAFLLMLLAMGAANLMFQAMANASVQTGIEPGMRGRVMGLYLLVFTGGTPLGGPLVGAITSAAGPRVGMAFCGLVPALAAAGVMAVLGTRARRPTRTLAAV